MEFVLGFGAVGVLVGAILGYAFSASMLLFFSAIIAYAGWGLLYPPKNSGSGAIGLLFLVGPFLAGLFLSMWGMWIALSWESIANNAVMIWESIDWHIMFRY